eukprot:6815147-Pyramimonas_sp.AAC.1
MVETAAAMTGWMGPGLGEWMSPTGLSPDPVPSRRQRFGKWPAPRGREWAAGPARVPPLRASPLRAGTRAVQPWEWTPLGAHLQGPWCSRRRRARVALA